jgi:hypothetical protein
MRKVLLATTALVAMSVSAAQADVSISGQAVFEIYSPSTGSQTFTTDGGINITGTQTTDTGLTFTAMHQGQFETAAGANDSYIDVAGDFGSVRLGDTDAALDRMDGATGAAMDLEGTGSGSSTGVRVNLASSATQIGNGDPTAISFFAPSMNGMTFYGQAEADGAGNGFGVNYTVGGVSLMAQSVQDKVFSAMKALQMRQSTRLELQRHLAWLELSSVWVQQLGTQHLPKKRSQQLTSVSHTQQMV